MGYTRTSWRRSSRRLYCTPRTTSPPSRSMRSAQRTRASCASARGRRGCWVGFPTADTAPPTPGHIPKEFLVLTAAVHGGPSSRSLRTPDHRQVGLREPLMRFLSPYAVGDDNLIVEETPAADVHVDDAELGAFLDEIN